MKPLRWLEQPRWLVLLALVFALAPVWLAWVTYREARSKDERLFETSAQMLADQLRRELERDFYFLGVLRDQSRTLDLKALSAGRMTPPRFAWQEKLPNLLAFGFAERTNAAVLLRWKSAEKSPVNALAENLADDARVAAALADSTPTDPPGTSECLVEPHRLLLLLALPGNDAAKTPRGYIVAWVDLEALCHAPSVDLIRDQILSATPLGDNEPAPTDAKRRSIRDGGSRWALGIARGTKFDQRYGPPTPWVAFTAVALSAVPLLVILVLAGRAAKLGATLTTEREVARQQRFFTQSVSHEFRTPLGIILSGAELLESYMDKLSPERRGEVLTEIKINTRLMNEMLERVLLLGRMESGKLSCAPKSVSLAAFCHEVARKVTTAGHAASPIAVNVGEREVLLDAALIGSVLENLLGNAVKYSAPGKPVTLTATVGKNQIVFTVRDEGIGIPAEDLPRVGDPFHRCANVGDLPGTGLGLAIAQRSTELHGGTLKIESVEGRGTTATVSLPLMS